jgi:hypothetical protein
VRRVTAATAGLVRPARKARPAKMDDQAPQARMASRDHQEPSVLRGLGASLGHLARMA